MATELVVDQLHSDLVERLSRDIREAARSLTRAEMRYLVDTYYQVQKVRLALGNAALAAERSGEPNQLPAYIKRQLVLIERRLQSIMKEWVKETEVGRWCLSIVGIGPVLAAGLLAHSDPENPFRTAGKLWRFAGLDPTIQWTGGKRPYNARLKVLCYRIGDSFCKFSNHPKCYYGHIYRQRKALEIARNEAGQFRALAEEALKRINDPETRKWYEQGMLPPGRIELRARRYAVKLFLAHYQEVLWFSRYRELPVKPYAIAILGHSDWIGVPNAHLIPGLAEAERAAGIMPPPTGAAGALQAQDDEWMTDDEA